MSAKIERKLSLAIPNEADKILGRSWLVLKLKETLSMVFAFMIPRKPRMVI